MTSADFRHIALSLEGAEEGSHMGSADFRVGGRIFATLAAQAQGYGNLMLSPELQADFVAEAPDIFIPIAGGWGETVLRMSSSPKPIPTCCWAHSKPHGRCAWIKTPRRCARPPNAPR